MRKLWGRVACSVCACLALFVGLTARGAEPPRDPVEAVWKPQHMVFHYRSEGTMYNCEVLTEKIKMILIELGARDSVDVRRVSCRDLAGSARLEVSIESPVAATEENIRDITSYNSEDELIARVNGTALAAPEDLERFPAVWEPKSFRSGGRPYLHDRDCALVQQLRRQIMTRMSVEVVKDIERVDCSLAGPRLRVLALVAARKGPDVAVGAVLPTR